jgi:hypothetical protein
METQKTKTSWLGSNFILGLLVTTLSIFTAMANYFAFDAGNNANDIRAEGDRLLANSNTDYINASQFIIVDYTMYDNYYVNLDVDDFAADYYQSQFSDELQASVDRDNPFDDQYYEAMYKDADEMFNDAFDKFDESKALGDKEAGFQFSMLIAAVGLSFAAYASLLEEVNRLRSVFAVLAIIAMAWSAWQFILVWIG